METIVAGFDGSESSERALARAAELARALAAKLVVVSVGPGPHLAESMPLDPDPALVPTGIGPAPPVVLMPLPPAAPDGPPEEQRLLDRARELLAPGGIEADYAAEQGDPVDRLLTVAEERKAALIVIGSHAHGFVARLLGLAVDEEFARRAGCDVLLVR